MPLLMLRDLPRYECLLEASREFPDLDPSATEVFLHLLRAGDEAFRSVEEHLARHEISQGRFGVLMALWGHERRGGAGSPEGMTPAELADHTAVTRATITGLVDTLERAGLVKRTPHQEDRRMMTVELTERGRSRLSDIMPEHFRRMAWLMASLSEEERTVFVRLLSKVMARAGERGAEVPADTEASPAGSGVAHGLPAEAMLA